MKHVVIYTDGACVRNPGPGGWAAVLLCDGIRREIAGGRRRTTNNRMELLAAIEALRALKRPCRVTIHSDSTYVVNGATNRLMHRWRGAASNLDLWRQLDDAAAGHAVTFQWLRGHAGDPENERCDELAEAASRGDALPVDEGYENPAREPTLFDAKA